MSAPVVHSIEDGVASIRLNRPDKLNAFTADLHAAFRQALDSIEQATGLSCVLLTGSGRAFCAGQDLNERAPPPGQPPTDIGATLARDMNPLISRLRALPVPVVAVVHGVAAGAGASLALAADIVVAGRSAKFSFTFGKIGLIPDGGATWILPRLVGPARAMGLALTGEAITADQAADWGLIWKTVEDDALLAEVDRLAAYFRSQPRAALAATKTALQTAWNSTLQEQLELERVTQQRLGFSADYAEGVKAFLKRRAPQFGQVQ